MAEMILREKDKKVIVEYQDRIKTAEKKHENKFKSIRDARELVKQILPEFSKRTLMSNGENKGNSSPTIRSAYCPPIIIAINNKISQELTSMPMRFEYEANTNKGVDTAGAFMKIIQRTYSQTGNVLEYLTGIEYLLGSGTLIAQPYTDIITTDVFDEGKNPDQAGPGEEVIHKLVGGRSVGYKVYDPQVALIDWRASPSNPAGTAEWIVVTIGLRSPAWIKKEYDIDVKITSEMSYGTKAATILQIDEYKRTLEEKAGLENNTGIMVREYYTNDGYVYHILDDGYVARKHINSAAYKGIPFVICPCVFDPDSPYGIPMPEHLRPSIELVATAINLVADNTAAKNKLPWFYPSGLVDDSTIRTISSGSSNKINDLVPINLGALASSVGAFSAGSIKDLIQKPEIQEVTAGAQFLFNEGMNNIWLVTGLNPTSVAGVQDKQVRIQGVADMINNAALRNSSKIVVNIESYFLNPLTRFFQMMYYSYYKDFPEFTNIDGKNNNITRDMVRSIKDIRVVNGSYLPSDQMTREQKASFIYDMAMRNATLDPSKATEYLFEAMGINMKRFERNPMELLDEATLDSILADIEQVGLDGFLQKIQQMKQTTEAENGEEGAAQIPGQ